MNNSQRQHDHFENIAHNYLCSRGDVRHQYLKEKMFERAFRAINLPQTHTTSQFKEPVRGTASGNSAGKEKLEILEPMCGNGGLHIILKKYFPNFTYEGFDLSESMIDDGRKKYPDLHLRVGDVLTAVPEKQYDIVVICGGLHHVHDQAAEIFKKIALWLKPEGYFVNLEPVHNNLLWKKIRESVYTKNGLFDERSEEGFTTRELEMMAVQAGLSPAAQTFPGLLSYILWYNPDAFPWLNHGPLWIAKKLINLESVVWQTGFARYFSFADLSVWRPVRK